MFCKILHDDGYISDTDYAIYNYVYDSIIDEGEPSSVIYVDVEPDICLERIKKRNRKGEENISIEYLAKRKSYYENMMNIKDLLMYAHHIIQERQRHGELINIFITKKVATDGSQILENGKYPIIITPNLQIE